MTLEKNRLHALEILDSIHTTMDAIGLTQEEVDAAVGSSVPTLAEKTTLVMRSTTHHPLGEIMAETTQTPETIESTPDTEAVEKTPRSLKGFINNHPRIAKVTGYAAVAAAAVGATLVLKSKSDEKAFQASAQDLDSALYISTSDATPATEA